MRKNISAKVMLFLYNSIYCLYFNIKFTNFQVILKIFEKENSLVNWKLTLTSEKEISFLDENLPASMLDMNATVVKNTSQNGDIPPLICVNDISIGFRCSNGWKVQNLISSNNLLPIFFPSPGVHSFSNPCSGVTINLRHNDTSLCNSTF